MGALMMELYRQEADALAAEFVRGHAVGGGNGTRAEWAIALALLDICGSLRRLELSVYAIVADSLNVMESPPEYEL